MSESSGWRDIYQGKKDEIRSCERNIRELNRISDNLILYLRDEVDGVNRQMNTLSDNLMAAVRHDAKFTALSSEAGGHREASADRDPQLRRANQEIQNEISRLSRQQEQAEWERDDAYNKYREARQREGSGFFFF